LNTFFDRFGESRNEAVRLVHECARIDETMSEEFCNQLLALYMGHVEDSRWDQCKPVHKAIKNAIALHVFNVVLPGTDVPLENQVANDNSPLTNSTNSNQQASNLGALMNAQNVDDASSGAISYIAAHELFPNNNGESSSLGTNTNTNNSNSHMSVDTE
jgi:hypothetical protein